MAQLRPYKGVLRNLGRRQHSVKKNVVSCSSRKKAEDCGKVSTTCYVNVFDAKASNVVTLLQDANREREEWKERCHYWNHKNEKFCQEHMQTLLSLCCDACHSSDDVSLLENSVWRAAPMEEV